MGDPFLQQSPVERLSLLAERGRGVHGLSRIRVTRSRWSPRRSRRIPRVIAPTPRRRWTARPP